MKIVKQCPNCDSVMQKGIKFWRCPNCKCILLRVKTEEDYERIAQK